MNKNKKIILVILDGWGLGKNQKVSAIANAKTPFMDSITKKYPTASLVTYGEAVGLPAGQMGNSEVGHLNIGAGRVVFQELLRINNALKDNSLAQNNTFLAAIQYAKEHKKNIHLMGLLSDGGVHSHIEHLKGLCNILYDNGLQNVFVHAFTDGRDTSPHGGLNYIKDLQTHLDKTTGKIASLIGRYYAMDRDNRWERIKLAYDLLVKGKGEKTQNLLESIENFYKQEVTDEFMPPIAVVADDDGEPLATIQKDDVVLCFNFRTDRCREITKVLTQTDMLDFEMKKLDLHYVTMTKYDENFTGVKIIFEKDNIKNSLGEILEKANKRQIRIAETEKYPHVTFFFSGGREQPFEGEERIMAASPKVATYDLQPEMSAYEITEKIVGKLNEQTADFVCLNFANADMVGHTGVFEAAVKAVETVDSCTKQVIKTALKNDYAAIIIADHGNADIMQNEDGTPHTAHTTNLVPIVFVDKNTENIKLKDGKLGDIATTILDYMKVEIPEEMTGEILIERA
ncbi:MAG: 2,3-bisphosphoglycerate-independent phosphoglycerate mutase [Chitinophagales bacterium]